MRPAALGTLRHHLAWGAEPWLSGSLVLRGIAWHPRNDLARMTWRDRLAIVGRHCDHLELSLFVFLSK